MTPTGTVTLRDEQTGSTASILSSLGFNCFSFRPVVDGEPVEVLWATDDFGSPGTRPTRSGIPILFPFAGRLRGQEFSFDGRPYRVAGAQRNNGNAIHGFVVNRPWRVVEQTSARTVGEFQASIDEPTLLDQWPADFSLSVSYEVAGPTLRTGLRVVNPADRPLPFALGTHPYFRLPLGAGDPAPCRITVPAAEYWEQANSLPTGRRLPVIAPRDLRTSPPFGELEVDDILTGLQPENGRVRTTIEDPMNRRTLTQIFDAAFPHCVVFTPPHRQAIAIEPYSCVPNPFALEHAGIPTGLRVLNPGESFAAAVEIRLD